MLFDTPFIADWNFFFGEHRQKLTDLNTARENEGRIDYDYKFGQKILVQNKGILHKAESVGTLPDGYVRTNPLPQVPTKQSVSTSRIRLPPYFGLPIVIPTLRRNVGPTIARARIPW